MWQWGKHCHFLFFILCSSFYTGLCKKRFLLFIHYLDLPSVHGNKPKPINKQTNQPTNQSKPNVHAEAKNLFNLVCLSNCGMVGGRKHCHFLLLRNESLSFVSNFTAISDYQLGKGYNPWLWMQLILVNCIHIHSKKESDNAFSQFNPVYIVSFKSPSPLLSGTQHVSWTKDVR